MNQAFEPVDREQRIRIRDSLHENLFVEAGAGTGKTTALVGRITALIASGQAEMNGLAAITFTDAAAGELRERVLRVLEEDARDDRRTAAERERCDRAARDMDSASIQTLHSFALSLLRELPLEAGLPPGFEAVDQVQSDLWFQDAWEQWLEQALDSDDLGAHILRALRFGLRLDSLRQVAVILHRNYDLVERAPFPESPPPGITILPELIAAEGEIRRVLPLASLGAKDQLYVKALAVADLGRRIKGTSGANAAIVLVSAAGRLSTSRGKQSDWSADPVSGVNGCKLLKDLLKGLEDTRTKDLDQLLQSALTPLLEALRCFAVGLAAQRKAEGRAEFHDLLVWARDLLRDNPQARQHFQRRFHHVLIDELQDTDPIQAEIAFFLAGNSGDTANFQTHDGQTQDWREIPPVPGKLFVVGDPKQSIYRFRRADIATLDQVRQQLGREAVPLRQNFRSQAGIIGWANHVFEQWMLRGESPGDGPDQGSPALQANYEHLAPRWQPPAATPPLGVHRLGEALDGSADYVRRQEARAVAALALEIKEGRWQVRKDASGALGDAAFQDICLLLPTRTGLYALEQALDEINVPYRIESQSMVLATEDVRELLNCIRAIDSPADQVALVAALRSSAFSCSDAELLEFVDDGGRFDYFRPGASAGPVAESLEALRQFHDRRVWTPPDELIEQFIRDRRMVELSFGRRRPRERWRRLRFVVEQARDFIHAGGVSLRGFVDWMERQLGEGAQAVEAPVPETDEDCVRIMTIHAAKGLEFPVVILTGLGNRHVHRAGPVIIDRVSGRAEVRVSTSGQTPLKTSGFDAANELEAAAEAAEQVRLAYVACTRARDHLVLSLFRKSSGNDNTPAGMMEQFCASQPDLWREIDVDALITPLTAATPAPAHQPAPNADKFEQRRGQWLGDRAAIIKTASREEARAVTGIARLDKDEAEGGEVVYRRGRGSSNLGRAVHSVLQSIDIITGVGLEPASRAQAAAEGVSEQWDEVASLARNALESDVVRRLASQLAAGQANYYREVFVSAPLNGLLVEGFIDLLIDGPDGMVVVDYKTDTLDTARQVEDAAAQHALQMGLYAWAAQEVTGKPVREAVLLFLRPKAEHSFTNTEALMSKAKEATAAG